MPVVTYLRDESLLERHWQEIYEVIGQELDLKDPDVTLKYFMDLDVKKEKDKISEIVLKAQKESEHEKTFANIEHQWKTLQLEFIQHKDTLKISSTTIDDITVLLEESLVTLSNTLGARFVDIIRDKV